MSWLDPAWDTAAQDPLQVADDAAAALTALLPGISVHGQPHPSQPNTTWITAMWLNGPSMDSVITALADGTTATALDPGTALFTATGPGPHRVRGELLRSLDDAGLLTALAAAFPDGPPPALDLDTLAQLESACTASTDLDTLPPAALALWRQLAPRPGLWLDNHALIDLWRTHHHRIQVLAATTA